MPDDAEALFRITPIIDAASLEAFEAQALSVIETVTAAAEAASRESTVAGGSAAVPPDIAAGINEALIRWRDKIVGELNAAAGAGLFSAADLAPVMARLSAGMSERIGSLVGMIPGVQLPAVTQPVAAAEVLASLNAARGVPAEAEAAASADRVLEHFNAVMAASAARVIAVTPELVAPESAAFRFPGFPQGTFGPAAGVSPVEVPAVLAAAQARFNEAQSAQAQPQAQTQADEKILAAKAAEADAAAQRVQTILNQTRLGAAQEAVTARAAETEQAIAAALEARRIAETEQTEAAAKAAVAAQKIADRAETRLRVAMEEQAIAEREAARKATALNQEATADEEAAAVAKENATQPGGGGRGGFIGGFLRGTRGFGFGGEEGGTLSGMLGGFGQMLGFSATIGAGFRLFSEIRTAISDAAQLDKQFAQLQQTALQMGQGAQGFEQLRASIIDTANQTGVAATSVATLAQEFLGLYNDAGRAAQATEAAAQLILVSGMNAAQAAPVIAAIVEDMNVSVNDLGNGLIDTFEKTGRSVADLMNALGQISPVAQELGLTFDQARGLIAAAGESSAKSGTQIGELLARVLPQLQKNLPKVAMDVGIQFSPEAIQGSAYAQFRDILQSIPNLNQAQRNLLISDLGGPRQAQILAAAFKEPQRTLELLNQSTAEQGLLAEQAAAKERSLSGEFARARAALVDLGEAVLHSGFTQFLTDIVRIGANVEGSLSRLFGWFGKLNSELRGFPGRLLEIVAALAVLQRISFIGTALEMLSKLPLLLQGMNLGTFTDALKGIGSAGGGAISKILPGFGGKAAEEAEATGLMARITAPFSAAVARSAEGFSAAINEAGASFARTVVAAGGETGAELEAGGAAGGAAGAVGAAEQLPGVEWAAFGAAGARGAAVAAETGVVAGAADVNIVSVGGQMVLPGMEAAGTSPLATAGLLALPGLGATAALKGAGSAAARAAVPAATEEEAAAAAAAAGAGATPSFALPLVKLAGPWGIAAAVGVAAAKTAGGMIEKRGQERLKKTIEEFDKMSDDELRRQIGSGDRIDFAGDMARTGFRGIEAAATSGVSEAAGFVARHTGLPDPFAGVRHWLFGSSPGSRGGAARSVEEQRALSQGTLGDFLRDTGQSGAGFLNPALITQPAQQVIQSFLDSGKLTADQVKRIQDDLAHPENQQKMKDLGKALQDFANTEPGMKIVDSLVQANHTVQAVGGALAGLVDSNGVAINTLDDAKAAFDAGTLSLSQYVTAQETVIKNLNGMDPKQRAQSLKAVNDAVSKAADDLRKEAAAAAALTGESPTQINQADINAIIAELNNPNITDAQTRANLVSQLQADEQKVVDDAVSRVHSLDELRNLLRQGIKLPPALRKATITSELQSSQSFQDWKPQLEAAGVNIDTAIQEAADTGVTIGQALQDQLEQELQNVEAAAASSWAVAAQLAPTIAAIKSALASMPNDLPDVPGFAQLGVDAITKANQQLGANAQSAADVVTAQLEGRHNKLAELQHNLDTDNQKLARDIEAYNEAAGIDPNSQAAQDLANQVNQDKAAVQRDSNAIADQLTATAQARTDYFKQLDRLNPTKLAQDQEKQAQNDLQALGESRGQLDAAVRAGTARAEEYKVAAEFLAADQSVADAAEAIVQAQYHYLEALAKAHGDPAKAAGLQVEALKEQRDSLLKQGADPHGAQITDLNAQIVDAQQSAAQTQIQQVESQVQTQLELGKMTRANAIATLMALRAWWAAHGLAQRDLDQISLEIKRLQGSTGNVQFDIPQNIALPTLYEARRLNQTPGGVGYSDNRNIQININAYNGLDVNKAMQTIAGALGGSPSRVYGATRGLTL